MHSLIHELAVAAGPHVLSRLPLDDGALVALFALPPQFRGAQAPLWIAKTSAAPAGKRRLAAEAQALTALAPLAAELGAPRLLGFREGNGHELHDCLVQTGLAGRPVRVHWGGGRRRLPPAAVRAFAWLERFQAGVAPPRLVDVRALAVEEHAQALADARRHPGLAPLLLGIAAELERRQAQLPEGSRRLGVAIHGDFWAGNVLFCRDGRVQVVDWSGFATGTALDDVLTWLSQLSVGRARASHLAGWLAIFFVPGHARDTLRAWALARGYSDVESGLAFYRFLLWRLSWELGLRLQYRGLDERSSAERHWGAILAWLAQHGYPDPFQAVAPNSVGR